MKCTRNLAWKLNWYRHSEMDGALLLGRVLRAANDPDLICSLTRHCADEARHAWMWAKTIDSLGLPVIQIFRSYQSLYAREGNMPTRVVEVLALTNVFEHRVDCQFRRELEDPELPDAAARIFRTLLEDEQDHLDWVSRWLANHPEGPKLLDRYRAVDGEVYEEIRPFLSRIWDIPGLGRELSAPVGMKEMSHVAS